jgi:hypothetical protein
VWYVPVWYNLEERVLLYVTHVKYGPARKCRRKLWCKFCDKRVPSGPTIHNLVNKLRTTALLLDKKQKHEREVLTENKLDATGPRLEHTPRKSLQRLAQENGVSKFIILTNSFVRSHSRSI